MADNGKSGGRPSPQQRATGRKDKQAMEMANLVLNRVRMEFQGDMGRIFGRFDSLERVVAGRDAFAEYRSDVRHFIATCLDNGMDGDDSINMALDMADKVQFDIAKRVEVKIEEAKQAAIEATARAAIEKADAEDGNSDDGNDEPTHESMADAVDAALKRHHDDDLPVPDDSGEPTADG